MFKLLLRGYKPKIQFRVGHQKKNIVENVEEEKTVEPVVYEKPLYLAIRKKLNDEEINLLNQGGVAPAVHWKKIAPLTNIHLDS